MSLRPFGGFPANDYTAQPGAAPRDLRDDQLEQVRELLFGDQARDTQNRLSAIEQRLATLEARVQALAHEHVTSRKETLDDLSRGISELGDYIKRVARP